MRCGTGRRHGVLLEVRQGQRHELQQQIVHLVLVAHVGPQAFTHRVDRCPIEPPRAVRHGIRQRTAQLHGAGPARFQVGFVKVRVGHGIQQLMCELRRHGRIHGKALDAPIRDAAQQGFETLDVHGLGQRIAHHLAHQRVIRYLNVTGHRLRTRRGMRKHAREQIVGTRALHLRGHALPLLHAQQLQAATGGPAPSILEQRRRNAGLLQQLARGELGEVLEDVTQRKTVLLGERYVDAVIRCRCLQLEVETTAEALAQRQSPRLVQAATEGCMQDELLPSALIEEALGDDRLLGGHSAQYAAAGDDVGDQLQRRGLAHIALAAEPGHAGAHLWVQRTPAFVAVGTYRHILLRSGAADSRGLHVACAGVDLRTEITDAVAQLGCTLRRFALPERDAWRRTVGVFDEHLAPRIDALDTPARVAQQHHIARMRVHRKVLVQRGDLHVFRLQHDGEERGVRDGATVGDRRHARATAAMQLTLHAVTEQVCTVSSTRALDAVM